MVDYDDAATVVKAVAVSEAKTVTMEVAMETGLDIVPTPVVVLSSLNHDGVQYEVGDTLTVSLAQAQAMPDTVRIL